VDNADWTTWTRWAAREKFISLAAAMKYLRFYLDRDCVVVPCQPGTKKLIRGAGEWAAEDSRANPDRLTRNAAMRNGTGGLLVVDIDAKNGGSLDLMAERFPGNAVTRMIQTVSPGKHGLGLQLIYALPDGFKISPTVLVRDREGRPMIEVASFSMLPGSTARGAEEPPDAELSATDDETVELPGPVSSANATAGMDAIAAPTPKATASAPTDPT
jgi:hypothetical protein